MDISGTELYKKLRYRRKKTLLYQSEIILHAQSELIKILEQDWGKFEEDEVEALEAIAANQLVYSDYLKVRLTQNLEQYP